jgi:hypothetical protein
MACNDVTELLCLRFCVATVPRTAAANSTVSAHGPSLESLPNSNTDKDRGARVSHKDQDRGNKAIHIQHKDKDRVARK